MNIILDKGTKNFLEEVKVNEKTFTEWITDNIDANNHKHVIVDGNSDTRVFRVFKSEREDTIISLSGIECLAIPSGEILMIIEIPNSLYGSCNIQEASDILHGRCEPTKAFTEFLKKANSLSLCVSTI